MGKTALEKAHDYNPFGGIQRRAYRGYQRKKRIRKRHRRTPMVERYPEFQIALEGMEEGGGLKETMLRLAKAKTPHMGQRLRTLAPYLAMSQLQGEPFQFLQDFGNLDRSMEAFGAGAERLGQGAQRAGAQARAGARQRGLGGSGVGRALAARAGQQGAGATSDLYSTMYQRGVENQNRYALDAFENQRMITQMALGATPYPRTSTSSRGGLGPALGQAIGAIGGMFAGQGGQGLSPVDQAALRSPMADAPFWETWGG